MSLHGHAHSGGSEHGHAHGHGTSHGHGHGHDHGHAHGHGAGPGAAAALTVALALTAGFLIVEAAVGFWSGSLALLADAGHMLADAGALGLALLAQRFAIRPRTVQSTYGFRRAEVLAAFVNGMTLSAVAALIAKEAVERWLQPAPIAAVPVLWTASAGLFVNLLVALVLSKSHGKNANVRAALAHVLSDALGSLAAMTSAVCVLWFDAPRADPVVSILIALLIARTSYRLLRETAGILLEGVPRHLDAGAIQRTIAETPGVLGVHDLHVWQISDDFDALSVHIVIERGRHGTEMCRAVAARLASQHRLTHVTIQPEPAPPDDLVQVRRSEEGAVLEPSRPAAPES